MVTIFPKSNNISMLFLLLVCVQAAHSIEEYFGTLWEVFPPATWLTGIVSNDLHLGFLIINIGLFVFGILCWFLVVRPNHKMANVVLWFWIILELTNGIGHSVWSLIQKGYTPGMITAPFLFIVSFYLMLNYLRSKKELI